MKSRYYFLFVATLVLSIASVLLWGCKKDDDNDPGPNNQDPPTYTDGKGEIGSIGGTVMIDDPSSPIDGASIEIPEDALNEKVNISITAVEDYSLNGENLTMVKFEPEGLIFNKGVKIGVPFNQSDQNASNSNVYYLNEDSAKIVQLEEADFDLNKKIAHAYTNHFSLFYSNKENLEYTLELVKNGNSLAGYFNLESNFNQVPGIRKISSGRDADDIIEEENGLENCFVKLQLDLYEKEGWFDYENVARQIFYFNYDKWSGGWSIWIDSKVPNQNIIQIFNKEGLTFDQMTSTWMSGFPLIANFDEASFFDPNYSYNTEHKYKLESTWGIIKDYNGYLKPWIWTYLYVFETENIEWDDINSYAKDANKNDIVDSYEGGGTNDPPTEPSNPNPDNNASNISINTNLSWTCSDPDDDPLDYDIYFGEDDDPPLVEEYYSSTNYDPGQLNENTTYYWYIVAFDDYDHSTIGPVWEFTTAEGGGGNGCDGQTTLTYGGQTYDLVEIGDQCWMAENLNYETGNSWCYDNDPSNCDIYGRLYDLETALGVCPSGWHLPSDDEWKILEGNADTHYGVGDPEWDDRGFRGYDAGKRLKSTTGWYNWGNGTDAFGFAALPGGGRTPDGNFYDIEKHALFFSSGSSVSDFDRHLVNVSHKVDRNPYNRYSSVRCLKD